MTNSHFALPLLFVLRALKNRSLTPSKNIQNAYFERAWCTIIIVSGYMIAHTIEHLLQYFAL